MTWQVFTRCLSSHDAQWQDQQKDYPITVRTTHLKLMKTPAKETDIRQVTRHNAKQHCFYYYVPKICDSETKAEIRIGNELTRMISRR